MLHDLSQVADHLGAAVAELEEGFRLDQAVYGLDSLSEVEIQKLLAERLTAHYEVAREVHYPSSAGAKRTHRMRCDVVLSPKGWPLKLDTKPAGLFDPVQQCEPGNALWLEVKVAYQFREGGVRHTGYGAKWRQAVV